MQARWKFTRVLVLSCIFAFFTASCESNDPLAPEAPTTEVQAPETQSGEKMAPEGLELRPVLADDGQTYTLVEIPAPEPERTCKSSGLLGSLLCVVVNVVKTVTDLIGPEGGLLAVLNHTLFVPEGAVDDPTLFVMSVLPDGHVHVDLRAFQRSWWWGWYDIGSQGFDQPVTLSLSYLGATNLPADKIDDLVILRMPEGWDHEDDAVFEVVPSTVNPDGGTVSAELDHFSGYCLAW